MYKGSPQKGSKNMKPNPQLREGQPPDLWIDHDRLELKSIAKDERAESSISVASTRRNSLSSVHTNNQGEFGGLIHCCQDGCISWTNNQISMNI